MTELNETTFPKTGRVNEVCREWIVREDNALAHQLQSQEIHEHLRGNRFRNQVVRQDFPTALTEQIKEHDIAEQQTAMYHEMVSAQAEADAVVALQLAEKLKRDDMERRRNVEQNEFLARRLQDDLILDSRSVYSTESTSKELPILPPKKSAMRFNGQPPPLQPPQRPQQQHQSRQQQQQQQHDQYDHDEIVSNPSYVTGNSIHRDSPQLNYVSLELNVSKDGQRRLGNHHATQYTQVLAQNQSFPSPPLPSPSDTDSHHYEHINLHSHTPEKKVTAQSAQRDYSFPSSSSSSVSGALALPPKPNKSPSSPSTSKQYELPKLPPKSKEPASRGLQMLTTDSFDMLMGNRDGDECDSLAVGGVEAPAARNTERVFSSNTPDLNRIDSMDEILEYDDDEDNAAAGPLINTDRVRQLRELGVPPEEILEIDRRLTQQEKDEELARRLQEEEGQSMTQEQMDRMVAIEAQDKELARMLQEREKAKARRAKERARARKQQQQQERMQAEGVNGAQYVENASAISHTRSHSDPNDIEHDSYSDPIDLIQARENARQAQQVNGNYAHSKQSSGASRDSLFHSDENSYSNPVDSLRAAAAIETSHNVSPPRPTKQHLNKSSPRAKEEVEDDQSSIEPATHSNQTVNPSNSSAQAIIIPSTESQNFLPAHLKYTSPDQNTNPIPPYMPIQGIRRSNGVAQSEKKKKSKDNRCTHQ